MQTPLPYLFPDLVVTLIFAIIPLGVLLAVVPLFIASTGCIVDLILVKAFLSLLKALRRSHLYSHYL